MAQLALKHRHMYTMIDAAGSEAPLRRYARIDSTSASVAVRLVFVRGRLPPVQHRCSAQALYFRNRQRALEHHGYLAGIGTT